VQSAPPIHMVAKALTKGFQTACLAHMTKSNQQTQRKNIETRNKKHGKIDFSKFKTNKMTSHKLNIEVDFHKFNTKKY
jgi:phage tail tube protein FII